MLLLDDAKETLLRLQRAEQARSGVEESQELEGQRQELAKRQEYFRQLLERVDRLSKNGVKFKAPAGAVQIREKIQTTTSQFRETPNAATLKASRRLMSLLSSMDKLGDTVVESQKAAWQKFFSSKLFGGLSPAAQRSVIALTPSNKKSLENYSILFNQFSAYQNKIPETQEEFNKLNLISIELGKITFDKNVPESVAKFFSATASNEGANLELLTSEVVDWLRKNHLLDKYVVRAHRE